MKRLIFTLLLVTATMVVMAIPAKRVTRVVNIDGKSVTITLVGDENMHYWQAEDGTPYRLIDDQRVERFDLSTARANMQVRQTAQMKQAASMASTADGAKRISQMNRVKYSGERRGLVILAQFKDKKFTISNTQATYADVMGKRGYSGNGQFGSVRDYFYSQSYGQFDFVLDVVGPVTLSQNMAYYGGNDSSGSDQRPAHMAKEACQLADAAGVDFTQYDWDNDGYVEQVFIIYAGYGEAQGGAANTIWPHAWVIEGSGSSLTLDGKRISSYACGSELSGYSGSKMDGIGTVCHEFSHCFGLPDFYCTDYNHDELTMSYWSIMDSGSYSHDGYCPTAYTAYERWACGWMEPKELSTPMNVTGMSDIETSDDAYILYNQKNRNEYYIMYNVQNNGWNTYAMGHGMMVLHVDYSANAWNSNTPNNDASHLRMTPICADNERGKRSAASFAGDPYPGTKKNTSLTDTTKPAAELFNANIDGRKYMGKPIEEITERNGKISFVFDGGVPDPTAPTNVTVKKYDIGFNVYWDAAENAATYDVEYGEYDQVVAYETQKYVDMTFDFGVTSDGSADISGKLDDNISMKGCTGGYLYKGKYGLKLGRSNNNGYITTPALDFESDEVEVTIVVSPYSDATTSQVSIMRISASNTILEAVVSKKDVDDNNQEIKAILSTKDMSKIRIGATGILYLHKIVVRDLKNPYGEPILIEGIEERELEIEPEPLGDAYYVRVRGVNERGRVSEWSDYCLVIYNEYEPEPEVLPAGIPQNVRAEQDGDSFVVTWDKAENAVAYTFEYREDGAKTWTRMSHIVDTAVVVTPENLVRTYQARVFALNCESEASEWSDVATVTFQFPVDAPMPSATVEGESFTVAWEVVENAVSYIVEYAEEGQTPVEVETTDFTLTVTPETLARTYSVRVCAVNRFGDKGEYGQTDVTFQFPVDAPMPSATAEGESFSVAWDAVENAVSYIVEYAEEGQTPVEVETTDLTLTVTPETLARTYSVRVCAVNRFGDKSEYGQTDVTFQFPVEIPELSVKQEEDDIVAEWAEVENAVGYVVECGIENGEMETVTQETAKFTFTPAEVEANYCVRVCAVNRFGDQSEWAEGRVEFIATSINDVKNTNEGTIIYSIDGRRVTNVRGRGLYIVNGKKVIGIK